MNEEINKTETASEVKLETQVIPLATKVKKYVEAKVVIEPSRRFYHTGYYNTSLPPEELAKREVEYYREWAKEVKEFFRDHRHQDVNDVYVDITEIDACSKCGESWETYIEEETGDTCCANCGALVKPKQVV